MARYIIAQDGSGHFSSLGQAAAALSAINEPLTLFLKNGVYEERVFWEWPDYTLEGESREGVVLTAGVGGNHPHPQGGQVRTFRTTTAFLGGGRCQVRHMTIANTAGDGAIAGQALAVYADASQVYMEDVALLGNQDTLFCAPLPLRVRIPGGFTGPRQDSPRLPTRQLYRSCIIQGNIDFIFGGGDCVFSRCLIKPLAHQAGACYIAAPSTPEKQPFGFLFADCTVEGNCTPGQVFLARPWRRFGAAGFLRCQLSQEVNREVFDPWGDPANKVTSRFFLMDCTGPGAAGQPAFGLALSPQERTEAEAHIAQRLADWGLQEPGAPLP